MTLCNCDCKLLTSAICRGLHWYTMRCIHPSQRCISSRQMTDNIFEIETPLWPMWRVLRKNQVSLLTDVAAAYPSVNHSWIFSVLENTGLRGFLCRFLRSIYSDSITHVELIRGSRPRTIFLWPEVLDKAVQRAAFFFRWPSTRSLMAPRGSHPWTSCSLSQCACADDLAAASSFTGLMAALASI